MVDAVTVTVWSVPTRLRPLASGLAQVMSHVLGDVPSPPLVGLLQGMPRLANELKGLLQGLLQGMSWLAYEPRACSPGSERSSSSLRIPSTLLLVWVSGSNQLGKRFVRVHIQPDSLQCCTGLLKLWSDRHTRMDFGHHAHKSLCSSVAVNRSGKDTARVSLSPGSLVSEMTFDIIEVISLTNEVRVLHNDIGPAQLLLCAQA